MLIFFLLLFFATLTSHHWINGAEIQPYTTNKQQTDDFPFKLGKDPFNEHMEDLFRDLSRKKSLPATSLAILAQDQRLLVMAQQLYDETKNSSVVQNNFAKARASSFHGEALWEWQTACCAVNKTLRLKIKEYRHSNTDLNKSDIEQILLLTHFAFQQNKYLIEKQLCQQNNREHIHRWFIAHNHKGKL